MKGKVAVVTGSGRGIGREIAVYLAKQGANVVVNVKKRVEDGNETLAEVRKYSNGIMVQADVSTRAGARHIAEETQKEYGQCDILVNNAGLGIGMPFLDSDDRLIEKMVSTNYLSAIYCTQELTKIMPEGGSIIMMASLAGIRPMVSLSLYGSLKAAIIKLTEYLALEFKQKKIRVNSIAPSIVKTKMGESLIDYMHMTEDEYTSKHTLTGSIIYPEEIAKTVDFLVSSPNITGQTIVIDSGQSLIGDLTI
ncbi:3-oxoacyl-[acyl-carrier-protein] reductase related protein [Thermoplasma acidophilum]|uniref:3-oxoacyl-[acyl-carrier-protein] reductase related protein n=1 Tax=Thermoplasma acidophilum (strain ATCC 25905 / DSM 1728 / JCM 9062 / NBRC 15155 / AMRC-C165) TaxID=273075 RepID=Q9HKZ9_THEAC|nr:3-oxoacyl-[acyl-carrier-protein] reductase related protein [Thermoplasma acidophilum]